MPYLIINIVDFDYLSRPSGIFAPLAGEFLLLNSCAIVIMGTQ